MSTYMHFTVFSAQQWTSEKIISGQNVYSFMTNEMRDETPKDNRQTAPGIPFF